MNIHAEKPIFRSVRCCYGEGGNDKSSKSEATNKQYTAGTGGANSPNISAQEGGSQNFGTATTSTVSGVTGDAIFNTSDQGAIDKAFAFGDSIVGLLGNVVAGSADAQAKTQNANTDFLSGVLGSFSAQTDAGQKATSQKTLTYAIGAVVALAALYFIWGRKH